MTDQLRITEAHHEYRERVSAFCNSEIEPIVEEHEQNGTFPADLIPKLGEKGFIGIPYPEEYGGGGQDYRSFAIGMEEMSQAWKLVGGAINVCSGLVGYPIYEKGQEWQREEWLSPIFRGEIIGALGMTEPEAGSDASSIETTAEPDGDELVIDGHKVWMTNGEIADFMLVLAKTEAGPSLIGVPNPWNRSGVEFVRNIPCMEGEASIESEVIFNQVHVPAENVVGEPGKGLRYVLEGLDVGRMGTAAQGVGVAQAAMDASREYADEREQFGQPIREFQGISFKLADMRMETEAARLLTLSAADKRDRGHRITEEAAMAKAYATDAAMDVATEAVQIHGSKGYSKDYPVERHMRVAKGMQIYEGTNEINRVVISNRMYE
jgi:alkylation response protein AidB-like acyl-CoA dehydrogenase